MIRASARQWPRAPRSRDYVWLLAVLGSAAVGLVLGVNVKLGVALLAALCFAPLALIDVGAGLVLWIPLPFLAGISALNGAGKAAGVLVAAAWVGVLGARRAEVRRVIADHRVMFVAITALCVWVTLSAAWASVPSLTETDLWHWYAVALIFLIIASTVQSRLLAQVAAAAFVLGAVLSVAYGLAGGVSGSEAANTASYGGRLGGATGDPNFLAAGVVPAIALTAALLASARELPSRMRTLMIGAGLVTLAILMVGVVASQSRGGLVALLISMAIAFFAFPRQRRWVASILLVLLGVAAVAFALSPGALQRVTAAGNGSGRADEWTIAWRVLAAHPVTGAGDANFVAVARDYTRAPGTLTEAQYLVDQPHVAHNTFLQFLSETGIVGFALFVTIGAACMRAAWVAARRFAAFGDWPMEALACGVVVALGAMLTASAFISAEVDQRLWTLLALGPAMLAVAAHRGSNQAERTVVRSGA